MRRFRIAAFALIASASLAACGRSDPEEEEYDFALDASGSTLGDAGYKIDAKVDAKNDGGEDAVGDHHTDAIDAPSDQSFDAPPDIAIDAPPDIAIDEGIDAPFDVSEDAPPDAGPDAPFDAKKDGPTDAKKDKIDFFDVFPFPDSGPIATCANCAQDHCSNQINNCFNNASCTAGVECAFTQCFANGQPSFGCLVGCFNGNFGAMFQAIGAFQCVINNCGQACAGVVGGGGGGGGAGGGGATDAGGAPPPVPPGGLPGGYPVEVPSDFVWPDGVVPPDGPIVIPPPQAFDGYPGVIPACGAWLRPACVPTP